MDIQGTGLETCDDPDVPSGSLAVAAEMAAPSKLWLGPQMEGRNPTGRVDIDLRPSKAAANPTII